MQETANMHLFVRCPAVLPFLSDKKEAMAGVPAATFGSWDGLEYSEVCGKESGIEK